MTGEGLLVKGNIGYYVPASLGLVLITSLYFLHCRGGKQGLIHVNCALAHSVLFHFPAVHTVAGGGKHQSKCDSLMTGAVKILDVQEKSYHMQTEKHLLILLLTLDSKIVLKTHFLEELKNVKNFVMLRLARPALENSGKLGSLCLSLSIFLVFPASATKLRGNRV